MTTELSGKSAIPERILLVNNNQMGLSVRKAVLEDLGYHVTAIRCGVEAFNQFCEQSFDLVITDYRMPTLNGIELTARIRERNPRIPVVIISGLAEALGLDETNTGADIVIQKNCHEVATLTRAVTRLLSRRVPRKPLRVQTAAAHRRTANARQY